MTWGRVLCICKTTCFPVNYQEPMPLNSLRMWKECSYWSCKALNWYRLLIIANGLGQNRASSCQELSQPIRGFPAIVSGMFQCQTLMSHHVPYKRECERTLRALLLWHLNLAPRSGPSSDPLDPVIIVGRKRGLFQDLAAASNCKNTFLLFA